MIKKKNGKSHAQIQKAIVKYVKYVGSATPLGVISLNSCIFFSADN